MKKNKILILSRYNYLKIVIWFIFLLPLILSIILIYYEGKITKIVMHHEQLLTKLSQYQSQKNKLIVDDKILNFSNDFITLFINIPITYEKQEDYKKSLRKYYSKNFYEQSNHILFYYQGVKRELIDKQYYDIQKIKDNIYDISYVVTYKLSEVGQSDNKIKNIERKQLIHLPMYINDDKYNVVDFPYFTPIINHYADYPGLDNYTKAKPATIERSKFRVFLVDFFKDYAIKNKENMVNIMKNPSSLNNERQFVELKNFQVFEDENHKILVKALVLFKDTLFNDMNVETYTLHISQKDNQYFIENLEHIR